MNLWCGSEGAGSGEGFFREAFEINSAYNLAECFLIFLDAPGC